MRYLRNWKEIASLVLFAAAFTGHVEARTATPFIPLGDTADAPAGFVEMCARDRALCGGEAPDGPERVMQTAAWSTGSVGTGTASTDSPSPRSGKHGNDLLARINDEVNRTVAPRTDLAMFGVDERWARPGRGPAAAGDCEDVALEKRLRLIDAGFASADLFFAVVYRRGFGLHTVLIARTIDGDHVLDSLTGRIVLWQDTAYSWLRVQAPGHPYRWNRIAQS